VGEAGPLDEHEEEVPMSTPSITRRQLLQGSAALGVSSFAPLGSAQSGTKVLRVQSKNRFTTLDPAKKLYADEDVSIGAITPMLITF
jgi:hypothetical protein